MIRTETETDPKLTDTWIDPKVSNQVTGPDQNNEPRWSESPYSKY